MKNDSKTGYSFVEFGVAGFKAMFVALLLGTLFWGILWGTNGLFV